MLKNEVIDQINDEITANGTGEITGPVMNAILNKIVELVPDQNFRFPKGSSVSTEDIGKLVMNDNGYAVVVQTSGAFEGAPGKWAIAPVGGASPYVPPSPTSPRSIAVYFNNTVNAVNGDQFILTLSSGMPITFTFYDSAPTHPEAVQIGVNGSTTIYNLMMKINNNGSAMMQGITCYYNSSGEYYYSGASFLITDSYPNEGLNLNVSWTGSFITNVYTNQYGSQGSYGGGYDYLYYGFLTMGMRVDGVNAGVYLNYADVFSPNAPSGTMYGGNKYPQNKTEFADNIVWALSNYSVYADGSKPFVDLYTITRENDIITIKEIVSAITTDFRVNYENNAPANGYVVDNPLPPREAYVRHLVLGVLEGFDGNFALISNKDVVKVKLNEDLKFQSYSDADLKFEGNVFYRLLKPVDGGTVKPIYPDDTNNDIIDELSPYFMGGTRPSYYSGYSDSLRRGNSVLVNSTIFYEALQEGNAGDYILARRFTFLIPDRSEFSLYDNGGYYY
ncbi:MAG: hypothetical protein JST49_00555 [Bacteroidetes bacterium]|nr:hypothetical protein [Bacteroidota bacterium]